MPIKVGDRLPETTFKTMTGEGPVALTTAEIFSGRKVVLVSVPGTFEVSSCEATARQL